MCPFIALSFFEKEDFAPIFGYSFFIMQYLVLARARVYACSAPFMHNCTRDPIERQTGGKGRGCAICTYSNTGTRRSSNREQ